MATVETWECPKCKWFYHSPMPIKGMAHKCRPNQMGQTQMRKLEKK